MRYRSWAWIPEGSERSRSPKGDGPRVRHGEGERRMRLIALPVSREDMEGRRKK